MQSVIYLALRDCLEALDSRRIDRARNIHPPVSSTDFALRTAFVILSAGLRWSIASKLWSTVEPALQSGLSASDVVKNSRKAKAITSVLAQRTELYEQFKAAKAISDENAIEFCATLPGVGKITKYHLAKNLGVECAKPDIWLSRVADAYDEDVHAMCQRLTDETGDSVAVVDFVIWRACERGWWQNPKAGFEEELNGERISRDIAAARNTREGPF